jgi:hypothetical protein
MTEGVKRRGMAELKTIPRWWTVGLVSMRAADRAPPDRVNAVADGALKRTS